MDEAARRRYPRPPTKIGVTVFVNNEKILGTMTMIDINEDGIGIISEKALFPGTEVYVTLKVINDYAIYGTVRWSHLLHKNKKTYYRMGIEAESIIIESINNTDEALGRSELVSKILSETGK